MLKYPLTILLLLLVGLQTFSKWCLIAEYQVNQDFIAKNLCINRLQPCSCCKGRCFLNKKLAADESQQQTPGKGAQREETVLQVHQPGYVLAEPLITSILIDHSTRHLNGTSQECLYSFFPPPKGLVFA